MKIFEDFSQNYAKIHLQLLYFQHFTWYYAQDHVKQSIQIHLVSIENS